MARKASVIPVHSADEHLNGLASRVAQQYVHRTGFWKPAHDRMDYHWLMYNLIDEVQRSKPPGYVKFHSNDPKTALDTTHAILTGNEVFWDIDMLDVPDADEEIRASASRIESATGGLVDDFSALMVRRGEGSFWDQAGWFAILRGWIAGKFIVTEESGRDDNMPTQGEFWDMRTTLPLFDGDGLHSVMAIKQVTFAQLVSDYGDNVEVQRALQLDKYGDYDLNLSSQAIILEWWDFRKLGLTGVLAMWPGDRNHHSFTISWGGASTMPMNGVWVQEPFEHEYDSTNSPITIVPVNGLPVKSRPAAPGRISTGDISGPGGLQRGLYNSRQTTWEGPAGWVADMGRGLLHAVELHVPQFNDVMATVLQKFAQEAYDSLFVHTRSGELPEMVFGIGAVNALRIEERVDRMQAAPASSDAWRILSLLQEEKGKGTISDILSATSPNFQGAAWLHMQMRQTALTGLAPYGKGMKFFGTMFSRSILHQLRDVNPGVLELVHRSRADTYAHITFDPQTELDDRDYKVVPRFEPALPDDIHLLAQTARLLLDPRNPVMSLEDVLTRVFRHPDAAGVQRRIWADVANREPVIILMNIVEALREEGQDELADIIEERSFFQRAVQDITMKQTLARMGFPGELPGGQETTAGAGLGPEAGGSSFPGAAREGLPPEPGGTDNAFSQTGAQA